MTTEEISTDLVKLEYLLWAHEGELLPRKGSQEEIALEHASLPRLVHQSLPCRLDVLVRAVKRRNLERGELGEGRVQILRDRVRKRERVRVSGGLRDVVLGRAEPGEGVREGASGGGDGGGQSDRAAAGEEAEGHGERLKRGCESV